jgi:hypothetical protein
MFTVLLLFTRSFSWARMLRALFVSLVLLTIGSLNLILVTGCGFVWLGLISTAIQMHWRRFLIGGEIFGRC